MAFHVGLSTGTHIDTERTKVSVEFPGDWKTEGKKRKQTYRVS